MIMIPFSINRTMRLKQCVHHRWSSTAAVALPKRMEHHGRDGGAFCAPWRGSGMQSLFIMGHRRLIPSMSVMPAMGGRRQFSSFPSHEVMGMPALSPTMEMGTIVKWHKKEGDRFEAGEVICEVETDKATVDYEAQDEGFIAKILCAEGSRDVSVGHPIFIMVEEAEEVPAFAEYTVTEEEGEDTERSTSVGQTQAPADTLVSEAPVTTASPLIVAPSIIASGRVVASPYARKMARENGVVLNSVQGTGPNGRIIASDIEAAAASASGVGILNSVTAGVGAMASAASSFTNKVSSWISGNAEDKMTGLSTYADGNITEYSKAYANQLAAQKQSVPHYHLTTVINLDNLLSARDQLNMNVGDAKAVSVNDFLLRAAALAMREVPEVNSAWMDTFIRQFNNAHINMVVATPDMEAIVAPVVPNVETLSVRAISAQVQDMIHKVQTGKLTGEELRGGTFTVSNMGAHGVSTLMPIVSPMQSCSLGLGTIETVLAPHPTMGYHSTSQMKATLACDHRVVDGAVGAKWLAAFKALVENPVQLLV